VEATGTSAPNRISIPLNPAFAASLNFSPKGIWLGKITEQMLLMNP
jgi:hypothetical protein